MTPFLSQNSENNRLEFTVDGSIFPQDVILKAAYTFLDRAYFFFRREHENFVVQIHPKKDARWSAETFALEYSDELLATLLRYTLERENKVIRETIVTRALGSYADVANFREINPSLAGGNQIDFDKDIDEILREIENDPDLKIDEAEISHILAEIEEESKVIKQAHPPKLDPNKVKDAKAKFQSR